MIWTGTVYIVKDDVDHLNIIKQERLFVCLRVCGFDRYAFKNYASYSKTKDIVGISVSMSRFVAQVRQSMAVINGFNGYPHFSIF